MERVINNDLIKKHSIYPKCCNTLNKISTYDSTSKNNFDPNIECLAMDQYEKLLNKNKQDKSADAVIGVIKYNNRKKINEGLLLVELRLLYKSDNNISKSELEEKIKHTKQLLGVELPILKESIFVFTDKVAPQAQYKISSFKREGGESKNFIVYSVSQFNDNVKLPTKSKEYISYYKQENIAKEFNTLIKKNEWFKILDKFEFWRKKIIDIRYSNIYEYESLKRIILAEWNKFRKNYPNMNNEENELNAQIIQEEFDKILS